MNKTALKNFATWSRRKLIEQVQTKAFLYGIDEKNGLHLEEQFGQLVINGQTYPLSMKASFTALQEQLEQKGYKQLLEEVAYTWFNRIIAIRYMEVHEYLPEKVNVLSSSVGRVDPDILFEFDTMDLAIDEAKVRELVNTGDTEAAFRLLFVAQCNALNTILPFMFEKIQDYTELLLPDFLLDAESVIKTLVQSEELTESFEEIEVIGWLYQYYMAEKKEYVGGLKNTSVVKEDLPVVTQLFTPEWIVKYLVQNSLGAIYHSKYPQSDLPKKWEFYTTLKDKNKVSFEFEYLTQLKIIDPACGSGHILIYVFEILFDMYLEQGYNATDAVKFILNNNIYGLEIDKRSSQIANFALMMIARSKSRRIFKDTERGNNIVEIQEYDGIVSNESLKLICLNEGEVQELLSILNFYKNAKQFGTLLKAPNTTVNWIDRIQRLKSQEDLDLIALNCLLELEEKVYPLLFQNDILKDSYAVVITNPPYHNKYNEDLKIFLEVNYNDYKADMYSSFMKRCMDLTEKNGFSSFMTPFTWMFVITHRKLREEIIKNRTLKSLVQLEYSAFKDATVPICIFNIQNQCINRKGIFTRLTDFQGANLQPEKVKETVKSSEFLSFEYYFDNDLFFEMPDLQIAYWSSEKIRGILNTSKSVENLSAVKQGLATAKDDEFLRMWYEVDVNRIGFNIPSRDAAILTNKKWFPFNKGGKFRKWYGNNLYIVNWFKDGEEIRNYRDEKGKVKSRPQNLDYYFKEGISWGLISSAKASFRISPVGFIPGHKGSVIYPEVNESKEILMAILNSKISLVIFEMIAPNIGFEVGNIKSIPIVEIENIKLKEKLTKKIIECIEISKYDWDLDETSWDFKRHYCLIQKNLDSIEQAYFMAKEKHDNQFDKIYSNELEVNKELAYIYGLENELNFNIEKDEITLKHLNKKDAAKTFLSYFIGCLFGRYSLDEDGLLYTGGEFKEAGYRNFKPIKSGIIHLTEKLYFEKDIISSLKEFLSVTFSQKNVNNNLEWLAEFLEVKKGENAEECLRTYFLEDFFKDHCKMYNNRPIYWLVDSGKQKGLRTLIYMHRYTPSTMATIRFEHLQEIQAKYQQEIADLENRLVNPNLSATDKKKLNAEKVSFEKKIDELREFDKRLAAIAAEEIEIDLDDGVKVNYEKFYRGGKGVLAKIK